MSSPVTDRLPVGSVLRILLVLLLVTGPHLPRQPIWATVLVLGLGLWRATVAIKGWPLPSNWLRAPLTIAVFIATWASFGSLSGQAAGIALLIVMCGLKLTEMGARRDYTVVLFLAYFLLITHFLYSQEIVMILYLFIATIAITAVLVEINHPQGPLPARVMLRQAAVLVTQAIPVMIVFFLLFPRIPGPVWGLPNDAGAGKTGLSERMEPGLISVLSQSDEVAFRVTFEGPAPPRSELYWRGPVFSYFDGVGWEEGVAFSNLPAPEVTDRGGAVDYELVLEPHGYHWLLALDAPDGPLPRDAYIRNTYQLVSKNAVIDRRLLRMRSHLEYVMEPELPRGVHWLSTRLPTKTNPRTRELAARWRAEAADDWGVLQRAIRHFREEPFTYTLQPPSLRSRFSPVDEFLFETQRGFCEHFASAFTVLMRAADIPARIVTGYQGGELHEEGDYYIVRQSDAHAWSEVWLQGRGWTRVDPTGAVSPDRIELGLGAAMPAGEPVPGLARLNRGLVEAIQLRWDMLNAGWNRWVLAYGPELQKELMRYLGIPQLRQAILALTVLCVGLLSVISAQQIWQSRPRFPRDSIRRDWLRFRRKLERRGIEQFAHEGPLDLGDRIAREAPALADAATPIVALYARLRYGPGEDAHLRQALRRRIRRFPSR